MTSRIVLIPVRVHDQCMTSEVFGSLRCDCKAQLNYALNEIKEKGAGVVVYLPQEGRGIGIANKIAAYHLQEHGVDTVDANRKLGLPDDARTYESARHSVTSQGSIRRLMTNNPKLKHLSKLGRSRNDFQVVKALGRGHITWTPRPREWSLLNCYRRVWISRITAAFSNYRL